VTIGWAGGSRAVTSVVLGFVAALAVTVVGLWVLQVHEFQEVVALLRRRPVEVPSPAPLGGEDPTVER